MAVFNAKAELSAQKNKEFLMKYAYCLIFAAALALAFSSGCSRTPMGPEIVFEQLEYDFGTIIQGDTAEHVFKFKNSGDSELKLEQPRTSCGCTASFLSANSIPPGGVGELKVSFNSAGRVDKQEKSITIPTNIMMKKEVNGKIELIKKDVVVKIKGTIKVELYFQPRDLNFNILVAGKPVEQTVTLFNYTDAPITIKNFTTSDPAQVSLSVTEGSIVPANGSLPIAVKVNPSRPTARWFANVSFTTDYVKPNSLNLNLFGKIADAKGVIPPSENNPPPQMNVQGMQFPGAQIKKQPGPVQQNLQAPPQLKSNFNAPQQLMKTAPIEKKKP